MDVTKAGKNTPRGLIQGLLSTASVSRSARITRASSRNIKTPITTKKSSTKRKSVSVETEEATPRTLIGRLLEVQSASKSAITNKRRRTTDQVVTEAHTSSNVAVATFVRKGVLKTPSENITPRTVIHSILKAATVESPAVHTGHTDVSSPVNHADGSQSDKPETPLPTILEQDDETEGQKEDEVTELISHGTESENETENGSDVDEEKNDRFAEEHEDITAQPDIDNTDGLGSTQDDHKNVSHGEEVMPQMSQSQQTQLAAEEGEEDTNQSEQTQLFSARAHSKDKSHWRNLVTPHIVPRGNITAPLSGVLSSEQGLRSQKPVKQRPPTGKAPRVKKSEPSLPSGLVKSIFQHFSKTKVSKEALQCVEQGSQLFFKQVSSDLMTFSKHAGRNTIEMADVELLIKRQGFVTDKQNLHSLIEKHLPMEYRQEIIPTVQSGNTILLK